MYVLTIVSTYRSCLFVEVDLPYEGPSNDKIRDIMIMGENDDSPVIVPFSGFRERLQAEKEAKTMNDDDSLPAVIIDKEKKSIPDILSENEPDIGLTDEERVGAHYRKFKTKPPPFTAEYITSNRFSPLDEEIRSHAWKNYKQSFAEKHFPFEYENPGELPEQRMYSDEEGLEEFPMDAGSGELDPYHIKGN